MSRKKQHMYWNKACATVHNTKHIQFSETRSTKRHLRHCSENKQVERTERSCVGWRDTEHQLPDAKISSTINLFFHLLRCIDSAMRQTESSLVNGHVTSPFGSVTNTADHPPLFNFKQKMRISTFQEGKLTTTDIKPTIRSRKKSSRSAEGYRSASSLSPESS